MIFLAILSKISSIIFMSFIFLDFMSLQRAKPSLSNTSVLLLWWSSDFIIFSPFSLRMKAKKVWIRLMKNKWNGLKLYFYWTYLIPLFLRIRVHYDLQCTQYILSACKLYNNVSLAPCYEQHKNCFSLRFLTVSQRSLEQWSFSEVF